MLVFAHSAAAAPEQPRTLFGRAVHAAPEPSAEQLEALRLATEASLEERGLVLSGDVVMPRAMAEGDDDLVSPPGQPVAAWDKPPHRSTIFLNFFGGPLKGGTNASEGESPCLGNSQMVDYPGYDDGEQKALAIIQVFKDAAAPFGLRIAYEEPPPKHLPYSQVMMGGRPSVLGFGPGILGVSCNLDCGDNWLRDTTFAFTKESNNVGVLGTTALQEAAHSFGLDHIDGENNIMFPYATLGAKVWADSCTLYNDATGMIGCEYVHKQFCPVADGEPGRQNDVAELMAYFGPNTPDTEAPVVTMLSPLDGQKFSEGDPLAIEIEVSDNHEGYGWVLKVPELNQELQAYKGQKTWGVPAPAKGIYTIRAEAVDHDGNIGFAEAKIYVDQDPPAADTGETPTTSESDGSGESENGGSESEGEGDSDSGGADSANNNPQDGDEGCSCRDASPMSSPSSAWLLVVGGALGLRRRRRIA